MEDNSDLDKTGLENSVFNDSDLILKIMGM